MISGRKEQAKGPKPTSIVDDDDDDDDDMSLARYRKLTWD
jgi:hypothetical protein